MASLPLFWLIQLDHWNYRGQTGNFLIRYLRSTSGDAAHLAAIAGFSPPVIGLTLVAFGTSSPGLGVSVQAGIAVDIPVMVADAMLCLPLLLRVEASAGPTASYYFDTTLRTPAISS